MNIFFDIKRQMKGKGWEKIGKEAMRIKLRFLLKKVL